MKRIHWLLVAIVLLGLASLLMSWGDKPRRALKKADIDFPRHERDAERKRNERRKTLPPIAKPDTEQRAVEFVTKRDPLLVALPGGKKHSTIVFEVSELKDSPIGKAWLDCLMKREGQRGIDKFQSQFGVNPLEDIERVGVSSSRLMILSMRADKLNLEELGLSKRTFGASGAIYEQESNREAFGVWGDSLVLVGPDVKSVEEALARIESKEPATSAISEWSMYGDIYGSISPEELAEMLPESENDLAEKVRQAVERVDLHVDASEDVAIVADVEGPRRQDIEDLGKSFGAALALGRVQAQGEADERLAELLEYAAVRPHENRFTLDVALPFDVLKEMGPCRKWPDKVQDAGRP